MMLDLGFSNSLHAEHSQAMGVNWGVKVSLVCAAGRLLVLFVMQRGAAIASARAFILTCNKDRQTRR